MKIKGIIFDLDGTLLYTLEDLKNSVNYALNLYGLKPVSLEETRKFVGNGVHKLIERAVKENKNYTNNCYKAFKEHYSKNSKITTQPYENAIENLIKLKNKGIKLAILSNKLDEIVNELVNFYFKDIFDFIIGDSEKFPKKPNKESTEFIIQKMNLLKKEVIFVGDSEIDFETAKNAGIECINVSWGYKNKDYLIKYGVKNIIDTFDEIYEFLD